MTSSDLMEEGRCETTTAKSAIMFRFGMQCAGIEYLVSSHASLPPCLPVVVACHWGLAALLVLVALVELDHQFVPVGGDQD